MYVNLASTLTERIISELRSFWATHPKYPELIHNIQGKYSFQERPQRGIIVKPGGSSHTRLSAQNFMGTVVSYLIHYRLRGFPGNSVEWVIEDKRAIQKNEARFPSEPGIYFVEVTKESGQDPSTGFMDYGEFFVDPLIDIVDEIVMMPDQSTGFLQNVPALPGSLRLFNQPYGTTLYEDENYTVDFVTGEINFLQPIPEGTWVVADYRFPQERTGPHYFGVNTYNNTAIPGAILAFGRRAFKGDRFAVIVQNPRAPSAFEFGGRWSTTMELDLFARDVHEQREMVEMSAIFLEGPLRQRLADEGILIQETSLGGESENIYDDTAEDFFYNGSISLTIETEWFMWVPLAKVIRSASPFTVEEAKRLASLSEEELNTFSSSFKVVESIGLVSYEDPFYFGNKRPRFATIR